VVTVQRVLITNDDGIFAPGIAALVAAFSQHYAVVVAAPKIEQSGKGHSFTYKTGLTYTQSLLFEEYGVSEAYEIDGTPADCVKLALSHILDELPDFVISGINCGENLGIASFYSGTAAAAREAAFWRLPAVAFSTDYQSCKYLAQYGDEALELFELLKENNQLQPASYSFMNINFPACSPQEAKGIKVCRQSMAYYSDNYRKEITPQGEEQLFVDGAMREIESDLSYDIAACKAGYITLTPLSIDSTKSDALASLTTLTQMRPIKGDAQ